MRVRAAIASSGLAAMIALAGLWTIMPGKKTVQYAPKGYSITPTGLTPLYPEGYSCSPLTSLYASWIDVDGTRREEPHSGVDGGRLGEWILAPGPGVVEAAWEANWGWGREGALLIRHVRKELNLDEGPPYYYSAFYHLHPEVVEHYEAGEPIARGERLAKVWRPGGQSLYLPEVHWEVWEIRHVDRIEWTTNRHGGRAWRSRGARLIDPLYMLALQTPPGADREVLIPPFDEDGDYDDFKGFTYILPCRRERA